MKDIETMEIPRNQWFFIEVTYSHGSVSLDVNELLVYTGLTFPSETGVGKPQMLEMVCIHPFFVMGRMIPNSNRLNASIASYWLGPLIGDNIVL